MTSSEESSDIHDTESTHEKTDSNDQNNPRSEIDSKLDSKLDELNELFANRYLDNDEQFMRTFRATAVDPPIVCPFPVFSHRLTAFPVYKITFLCFTTTKWAEKF